jgi:outer membrane protein OmpA-like peptidoglycan-associated protein
MLVMRLLKRLRIIILSSILLIIIQTLCAQEYSTKSNKAIKYYEDASVKMQLRDYNAAINILYKSLSADENFPEAWLLMADAYDAKINRDSVLLCCQNALKCGADKYPVTYYFMAEALYKTGKYEEAISNAKAFLDKKRYTPNQKLVIDKIIIDANFSISAMAHPVEFSPIGLGDNINTKYDEYWPSLSSDEEKLVFTRLIPIDESNPRIYGNRQEDIFLSVRKDDQWQIAEPMGPPINTEDNEGAQFITSDGKRMYFTACNRGDGLGKCDIYMSERISKGWSFPVNLGEPVNSNYSEKQPSVSSDGKSLYFVSNRPGGKGGLDIWMATLNDKGKWTKVFNLGDSINTSLDDQSPFIHPDDQTLYFASNGWPGMGGSDLYYSRRKPTLPPSWSKAINLGYPINTFADEVGLIVNANGNRAYFSSNRNPEKGKDIYTFELYDKARPTQVSYLKGKVYDAETKAPLEAQFELIDLKSSKTINQAIANKYTGEFLVCIPTDKDYALNVNKKGYLFYSENFTLAGISDNAKPFLKDIPLQSMKAGSKVVLKNIFFETNSFELKPESTVELNKILQFMNENINLKIEISGFTDNVGSDAINQKLSESRAKAVVDYLTSKGVSSARLISKGYGKTQPIANNNTDEGKALNRRTEFKITGF